MMKKSILLTIGIVLSLTLLLSACAPAQTPAASEGSAAAPSAGSETADYSDQLVIYVTSKPLGTNQFHLMGKTALDQLSEKYGVNTDYYESEDDPTNREDNVRAAVSAGANIIYVMGTEWGDIIPQVAEENPDVQFLIADQCVENQLPNIHCTVFKEYEASFLLGVMAGMMTKSNKIGAIGALDIPFLHRYTDGYIEGAKYINPDIEAEVRWVGGNNPFGDPARAKEQALALLATGADHIFSATAGGDSGVFEAASENDFFAYGVDINHCPTAPGKIVDNLLKHVDVAVVDAVGKILTEKPEALYASVGVAEGAVAPGAVSDDSALNTACVVMDNPEVVEAVKEAMQKIMNGEIVIEDPMFAQ